MGSFELRNPTGGDLEPFLAAVFPRPDGYPTSLHERAEIAGQGGLVMHRHSAQVALPNFARIAEQAEHRVLGRAEADAAQLLVVDSAHGP
jgi:hypothetical protein